MFVIFLAGVTSGVIICNVLYVWLCTFRLMTQCAVFEICMAGLNVIFGLQTGTSICGVVLNKRMTQ